MSTCQTKTPVIPATSCMKWGEGQQKRLCEIHERRDSNPYFLNHTSRDIQENIVPIAEHIERAAHPSKNSSSFMRLSLQGRLHTNTRYTIQEMVQLIDMLNLYLISCEMILAGEMQRISLDVYKKLKEENMLRHQLKKSVGELHAKTDDLFKQVILEDRRIVTEYANIVAPAYAKAYYEAGGSISNRLQMQFHKVQGERINLIILSTKNALDKICVPHSDIVAQVMTLIGLSTTNINLYEAVQKKIDAIHGGTLKITRQKSLHNESIIKSARNVVDLFVSRNQNVPEREGKAAQGLLKQLGEYMAGQDMFSIVDNCLLAMNMEYVEFLLSSLRIDMQNRSIPLSLYRNLLERMGTYSNVRQMLSQLGNIPVPEEVDAWDFAATLPSISSGTALNSFRRLCIENKSILPEKEDSHKRICRELRQVVRKCKKTLPIEVIKAIYADLKSKKKVMELLKEAGSELDPTARIVKKMKVSELK